MAITRQLMTGLAAVLACCMGATATTGVGLSGQAARSQEPATRPASKATLEDVYVARSVFSSPNLPVTSFCDAAKFPSDYPVERERHFEYWSTRTQQEDGLLVNAKARRLGEHHGCYSVRKNGLIHSYMTGTFAAIRFTARGTCTFNLDRAPQSGVTPYTCNYAMTDLSNGYVGGQSTWNGVTTDISGYVTTTVGAIRLWRRP
jgi:hypothetical protein